MATKINAIAAISILSGLFAGAQFVQNLQKVHDDPGVKAAIAANPTLATAVGNVSRDLRTVENDADALFKHFKFPGSLLVLFHAQADVQAAFGDILAIYTDPGVRAAIDASPTLAPIKAQFSQEIRSIEEAAQELGIHLKSPIPGV